jgi:hypothetical protein
MPVVSAQTEARLEGYFRREWRLAVERTLDMADDHLFLLPVVIDETAQADARVPERFLTVQWLKLPGGKPSAALEALCQRILSGGAVPATDARKSRAARRAQRGVVPRPDYPAFPVLPAGHWASSLFAVLGWALRWLRVAFARLPRWIRVLVVIWLVATVLGRACSDKRDEPVVIAPAAVEKLKTLAQADPGKPDIGRQAARFVRELAKDMPADGTDPVPLLAIPFGAPPGKGTAASVADATFTSVYGKLAVTRRGAVTLAKEPLASNELGAALERGVAQHATYVLYGSVEQQSKAPVLTIRVASVTAHAMVWSKSYPLAGSDPASIAAEVDSKVPPLEE